MSAPQWPQVKRTAGAKIGLPDERPDWDCRSVLTIEAGKRYAMRNGHTAEVRISKTLHLSSGQTDNQDQKRKERKFLIWYGRCIDCNEALGWNANGTYAAVGSHPFDLIRPSE